jgi:REP element-mobilizing transposase RayT
LLAEARARLNHGAVWLDAAERTLVAQAFGTAIRECGQRVFAASARSTHIHLVFAPQEEDIKTTIARLKRRSAVAVFAARRQMGKPVPRSMWTGGRFPVFINSRSHLINAIEYVRDHNRQTGLPADPYDWIEPLYLPGDSCGARVRYETATNYIPT